MNNDKYIDITISDSRMASAVVLVLPKEITADNVGDLLNRVKNLVIPGDNLILDASLTRIISSSGIECLLSIEKLVENQGSRLILKNTDKMVGYIIYKMGFGPKLEKWSSAS